MLLVLISLVLGIALWSHESAGIAVDGGAHPDAWDLALVVGSGISVSLALVLAIVGWRMDRVVTRSAADDTTGASENEFHRRALAQLGSEAAEVRLDGLRTLELLGQTSPGHRQAVVDTWCAYLRTSHLPAARGTVHEVRARGEEAHERARGEQEVRAAAQRLLADHLRPSEDPYAAFDTYWWQVFEVDLSGADLTDLDLHGCRLPHTTFQASRFTGHTVLDAATFIGTAAFDAAHFSHHASFHGTAFGGEAAFYSARFADDACFDAATFTDRASFDAASFRGAASFRRARFARGARFDGARFAPGTSPDGARLRPDSDLPLGWTWGRTDAQGWTRLVPAT